MGEIDYSKFLGVCKDFAAQIDPTPADEKLTASDIDSLSFGQKKDLYLKAMEEQDSIFGVTH